MKGVIFVKMAEFVEQTWGEAFWDELLESVNPQSGGAYTSVSTYDDQELYDIVVYITEKKQLTMAQAQQAFGKWLFKTLLRSVPEHALATTDTFAWLRAVQDVIHVEVLKLNPDSILPEFTFLAQSEHTLLMQYHSTRPLCYLCEGLIHGLAEHNGESVTTRQTECIHEAGQRCVIEVTKQSQ